MAEEITYYAIVDDLSTGEHPRRAPADQARRRRNRRDVRQDLRWARSALLYSAERGDLENKFVPISEDEAERIVSRIRADIRRRRRLGTGRRCWLRRLPLVVKTPPHASRTEQDRQMSR